MKIKSLLALLLAVSVCTLGGCAEEKERASVIVVDVEGTSTVNSSSSPGSSQAVSFSVPEISSVTTSTTNSSGQSGSGSGSIVSVVIPPVSHEPPMSSSTPVEAPPVSSETPIVAPPVQSSSSSSSSKPVEEPPGISSSSTSSSSVATSEPIPEPPAPVIPSGSNAYQTLNYSEVKGVWISYIELAGLKSDSESAFRAAIGDVYDNCANLGLNTVYVHVRSHSDAYYNSAYYPRTKYIDGSYDPLPVMIEEAHKRGLSFQAWINPLRGCSVGDIGREKGYALYDWAGGETKLVEVNGYYYLNPAYDEVTQLIANGAAEIVANYDVDGLHIDDYFYPTTEEWFDRSAYLESSYNDLSDFRFANCDKLVSSLYNAVKSANSTALFGVSPQGNYLNNYAYMYADVEKWCTQSGYLDYIMPQVYFGFKNAAQPFETVIQKWDSVASKGKVPLIIGLAPSKIGSEDGWGGTNGRREWIDDKDILKRQFLSSAETMSYGGICLYSYNSMFNPAYDVRDQVNDEVAALKSAIN